MATLAWYGPNPRLATHAVVAIVAAEGQPPVARRTFVDDAGLRPGDAGAGGAAPGRIGLVGLVGRVGRGDGGPGGRGARDVRYVIGVRRAIEAFVHEHGARHTVATDGIIGCPHEAAAAAPLAAPCPHCPYWAARHADGLGSSRGPSVGDAGAQPGCQSGDADRPDPADRP